MITEKDLARLAASKRSITILEQTAPASAGGLSAAVIDGKVKLTTWCQAHEITITLTVRELVDLRGFLNDVFAAALNGTEYPDAFIGGRK